MSDNMICESYKRLDKAYHKSQHMMFRENMFVPCYYKDLKDIHDDICLRKKQPSCIDKEDAKSKKHFKDVGVFHVPVTSDHTIKVKECRTCDCRMRNHQLFGNITKRH